MSELGCPSCPWSRSTRLSCNGSASRRPGGLLTPLPFVPEPSRLCPLPTFGQSPAQAYPCGGTSTMRACPNTHWRAVFQSCGRHMPCICAACPVVLGTDLVTCSVCNVFAIVNIVQPSSPARLANSLLLLVPAPQWSTCLVQGSSPLDAIHVARGFGVAFNNFSSYLCEDKKRWVTHFRSSMALQDHSPQVLDFLKSLSGRTLVAQCASTCPCVPANLS